MSEVTEEVKQEEDEVEKEPEVKSLSFTEKGKFPRFKKRRYTLSETAIEVIDKMAAAFKCRESVIVEAALINYLKKFQADNIDTPAPVVESEEVVDTAEKVNTDVEQ